MPGPLSPLVLKLGEYETWLLPLTALMIVLAVWDTIRPTGILSGLEQLLTRVARNPYLSVALVLVFAIGGPLALRPLVGIPDPVIPDEFSLLMQAQTYLRGQFANAPLTPNFEAPWTLLSPTYAAQYPVLRSLPLVLGYATGIGPWGGVLVSVALLALAVYWMVRVWIGPGFALVGALIVTLRFGLFTLWVNSYMGPAFTALGSVLVFAGYKILRTRPTLAGGAAFGGGIAILMTTRPYEGLLVAAPLTAALAFDAVRSTGAMRRAAAPVALVLLLVSGGFGLTLAENRAVTGDWKLFPYTLYRQQVGAPPAWLTQSWTPPAQDQPRYDWGRRNIAYDVYLYERRKTVRDVVGVEEFRLGNNWGFYVGFALTLPFVVGLWSLRRDAPVLTSAGLLALGLAMGTFDFSFYAAAGFGAVILSIMLGFQTLRRWRPYGVPFGRSLSRTLPLALVLAAAVPLRSAVFGPPPLSIFDGNAVNASCCWLWPRSFHAALNAEFDRLGGRNLVFADTGPRWPRGEFPVANDADLDRATTIWANQDAEFDRATIDQYPGRRVWRIRWLDDGRPCLQAFRTLTSAPGSPLSGDFDSLRDDPARGWLAADSEQCRGGLTRQPWNESAAR